MKIRAAVLSQMGAPPPYAKSRPLSIQEIDLAPPGYGEVLVKIAAAGLCHSDLSVINGDRPRPMPMVLGHEAAGIVEELGDGVTDLQRGDHVVLVFVPSCGHCPPCAEGRPALCEPGAAANGSGTLLSGARRLSRDGTPINHLLGCSSFAEYATGLAQVAREGRSRAAARGSRAVRMRDPHGRGRSREYGASPCRRHDGRHRPRRRRARVGAWRACCGSAHHRRRSTCRMPSSSSRNRWAQTHTFNATAADTVERVREATKGGVEYAFELAGSVRAFETAYKVTRRGGTNRHGGPSAADRHHAVVAAQPGRRGAHRQGELYRHLRADTRHSALRRPLPAGQAAVKRLMTGTLKLDDINEGFDLLHEGKAVRQVIVFD
jgi:alcohol dehydrogenase